MTPTEKARRAEALYYDNHNITRRTLCHRIANLEADLEDAKAENAKLRELCADIYEMAYPEYPSAFEAVFADRMRELGVEVDG